MGTVRETVQWWGRSTALSHWSLGGGKVMTDFKAWEWKEPANGMVKRGWEEKGTDL